MHIRNNDCKSDISEIDISDKFILFMTTSARIHHNVRANARTFRDLFIFPSVNTQFRYNNVYLCPLKSQNPI